MKVVYEKKWEKADKWEDFRGFLTHMSVMFSISASLRMGMALMPHSGSTQEILVLLQEQDSGHASADIHGSAELTAIPTTINKPHHKHRHDPEPVRGEDAGPLPGLQALILGCQLQL